MKKIIGYALAAIIIASTSFVASAQAADICDITDLPCWGPDKKCNIKFRNKTGLSSGSGAGIHRQVSGAYTTKIRARKKNGNRAGSNSLNIRAGASRTLNLDKKDNFFDIHITAGKKGVVPLTMECADIRATLSGSGKCDAFKATQTYKEDGDDWRQFYLAYKCAGGRVVSKKPKKGR